MSDPRGHSASPAVSPLARNRLARVVVIGATGSGKSTFAERLAARLGGAYVELDALHWEPHWTEAAPDVFRERVALAAAGACWVVAGNYSRVRDVVWPRADTVVWLDYPFPLVLRRLTARTVRRAITREVLWNGNRENLWDHCRLWSEKSLFNWLFKTYWAHRREFPRLLQQPAHAHLRIVRLSRPRDAEAWLAGVASG
jgi:adenylate kinase family enzyme